MSHGAVVTHGQQTLPTRELGLFRKIVKLYEQKQHKTALRYIRQIQSNAALANHGETMSMKALILDVTGHHAEAVDLAKTALRNDVKSHVCWHIFGMIMRSDRKFGESLKALKFALKLSPDNIQILRDLALVQAHIRDFTGLQQTRYSLLSLKPNNRTGWMGYITASYLSQDYAVAVKVIHQYRKSIMDSVKSMFAELFEILLFEIRILEESGKVEEALEMTNNPPTAFIDVVRKMETRARILTKLDRTEDAAAEFEKLILYNPDNGNYYLEYEKVKGIGEDDAARLAFYDLISSKKPRVMYPKIAALGVVAGDEFKKRVSSFVVDGLRKGLPSLFQSLRPLYADPQKVKILSDLLEGLAAEIDKNGISGAHFDGSKLPENPATVMWTLYLIAHHYDCVKEFQKAREFILRAIDHTPTVVELFVASARIAKHCGDMIASVDAMKRAQELDTADRYVNCKLVKYQMRFGEYEAAIETASKFAKDVGDPLTSMVEIQSLWIEVELAHSLFRRGELGSALKVCHEIETQVNNFFDDQYDFHNFCLRRSTISSYKDLLDVTDKIHNNRVYIRAATLATKIYLHLTDAAAAAAADAVAIAKGEKQKPQESAEERKKRRKDAKAKAQQQKNQAAANPTGQKDDKDGGSASKEVRFRIDREAGETFAKVEKPLEVAERLLLPLVELDVQDIEFYQFAYRLFERLDKFLLLTKIVAKAAARFPTHPDFYEILNQYVHYLETHPQEGVTAHAASAVLNKITGNRPYATFVVDFERSFDKSFPIRVIRVSSAVLKDSSTASEGHKQIIAALEDPTVQQKDVEHCLWFMRHVIHGRLGRLWSIDELREVVVRCRALHPMATAFAPPPDGFSVSSAH